ncbi:UDP-N-acetylglucosamine:LPS N-acetylglucosamine transferase [Agromyces sp. CF514]|uniref:glycosyltransferase n=1 Tax=Agromyces sp. CF514 TaxID=1881031 RepID=UPI0008E14533|nr:glycosyltransferase [Agromyces sp. CF514]SFR72343.1 UDP-N-acetylglucosamine:LPS N-acetylglucosamine transferase [Agromyces sp. CF514]
MTTMLVAISGGHLAQLHLLAPRIAAGEEVVWMTDDTAQSRSLLEGQRVVHVPTRPPRDTIGVLRDTRIARRAIAEHDVDRVVSSGAQIALSALIPALVRRVPFSYVESATRVTGLSTTGRLIDRIPSVRRYVQYPNRTSDRWGYALSVFDGYRVETAANAAGGDGSEAAAAIRRAVVTVGGNGEYGFRRLLESAARALPDDAEVLWQTGSTDVSGLAIDARPAVPSAELSAALARADVVIGHAGTGTALAALAAGKVPVLAARSVGHGEHVDGHQDDLAAFLADRGLAIVRPADEITADDLFEASRRRVIRRDDLAPVSI